MGLYTAQLYPGRALGSMVLGSSLHDILTRIKAEPLTFPKIELSHSDSNPVDEPILVILPSNGIRLRFDGAEQRLRLIEITDFKKNRVTFQDKDIVRPPSASPIQGDSSSGPTFRHIYHRLLGPTYDGEFIPPAAGSSIGRYVLSYPGVGFTFPLPKASYSPNKDVVSLLSSSQSQAAIAMAVFSGDSWAQARETLWSGVLPSIKTFAPLSKGKDVSPDEISLIKIHGAGKIQLFKNWSSTNCVLVTLGDTSPQDLVADLGPPDAIYRKNDQGMYIHKMRTASNPLSRPNGPDFRRDELIDTDQSSVQTSDEDNDDEGVEDVIMANTTAECFYNYFYLGFDILMSNPVPPSQVPPSQADSAQAQTEERLQSESPDCLVATKIVIHNNVPGSYPFNRHRRCRWEISYLPPHDSQGSLNSESKFPELQERLREEWAPAYGSEAEAEKQQRGMVLNRGWGDSPGSSCELLGGWEGETSGPRRRGDDSEDSTTTLYGFPGLVFEVLRNDYIPRKGATPLIRRRQGRLPISGQTRTSYSPHRALPSYSLDTQSFEPPETPACSYIHPSAKANGDRYEDKGTQTTSSDFSVSSSPGLAPQEALAFSIISLELDAFSSRRGPDEHCGKYVGLAGRGQKIPGTPQGSKNADTESGNSLLTAQSLPQDRNYSQKSTRIVSPSTPSRLSTDENPRKRSGPVLQFQTPNFARNTRRGYNRIIPRELQRRPYVLSDCERPSPTKPLSQASAHFYPDYVVFNEFPLPTVRPQLQ
ncbi:uncharacterized protein MKZ38_010441 [Zalerion maritima]|uniref:Uncharacterized protein n=1 Tax=Zalerion maritima TaxID=339359 RepID=A0AAD5RSB8_9PEZI|nr:uncharacterized protein MKZ38_010441 [Zalerion maritima]